MWLVFYTDDGNREDCSVYYCWLVTNATSEEHAKKTVAATLAFPGVSLEETVARLGAEQPLVLKAV